MNRAELIDALEAHNASMTPGPWTVRAFVHGLRPIVEDAAGMMVVDAAERPHLDQLGLVNAAGIACLRTLLPEIIVALRAAR